MENRLKLKLSKLFETCRSKNISDVSGEPFFFPENCHHRQLIALFSPNPDLKIPIKPSPFSADTDFRPNKTTKKKPRHRKPKKLECFSSTTHNYYYDWRSSDDDDDTSDETALFSSRSFRSESSGSFHKNRAYRKSEKNNGKLVKDSIAVAKKSSNPYEDFRVSMVEMIVEKQIFGAEELTNLFDCFISLNSGEHHRVICEVFVEILDAIFSGCH
ncbi:putative transcription factor OFP family [Helianthus debilis subsp. tardiflorus]